MKELTDEDFKTLRQALVFVIAATTRDECKFSDRCKRLLSIIDSA